MLETIGIIVGIVAGVVTTYATLRERRKRRGKKEVPPQQVSRSDTQQDVKNLNNLAMRNPSFTGRKEILAELRKTLTEAKSAALTALSGLGGIGKTQVALEYAHRHANDYDLIWWVGAETEASRVSDFKELAMKLKLFEEEPADARIVIEGVKEWLRIAQDTRWLLIFDNAENPESLSSFLPTGDGQVLITSRRSAWQKIAEPLDVKKLEPGEAREFLLKRSGQDDGQAAEAIAKELDYLPLALEQAGAYVEQTRCGLQEYLELMREEKLELLKSEYALPGDRSAKTVLTTWKVSFDRVRERSEASADLMKLIAFFAPDDIPEGVIREGAEHLPESLKEAVRSKASFNDVVTPLLDYSLISRSDGSISVHRLVQDVTRYRMSEDERKLWTAAAVKVVEEAMTGDAQDVRTWDVYDRLVPHGLIVAGFGECIEIASDAVARVFNQCGLYLCGRARYNEAKDCFERALKIDEKTYGKEHPDVAIGVNNLGNVLQAQGDLVGAKQCFERALKIDEEVYGKEHPTVARDVNNLGLVLQDQGDLDGAIKCFERALKIWEKELGNDHPQVAIGVNNLGSVLLDQGDSKWAKKCFERALKIDEKVYGNDHPQVATGVNNLGNVLQAQGDLVGAKKCFERALKIDEEVYGKEHPAVARDVNNLGGVLRDQGDLDGAKACAERALDICMKFLGAEHPDTKQAKRNLGIVLEEMKKRGE